MLELCVAVVCLALGFVGGCWMRRSAIADFERGVALGLAHMTPLLKQQAPQHPRHDNNQKPQQNNPAQK